MPIKMNNIKPVRPVSPEPYQPNAVSRVATRSGMYAVDGPSLPSTPSLPSLPSLPSAPSLPSSPYAPPAAWVQRFLRSGGQVTSAPQITSQNPALSNMERVGLASLGPFNSLIGAAGSGGR